MGEEYEEKLEKLKDELVRKLMVLTQNKTSQGVKDFLGVDVISKGQKFTAGALGSLSPLGVILPIMISPGITWAPTRIMPRSSRSLVASSLTLGMTAPKRRNSWHSKAP